MAACFTRPIRPSGDLEPPLSNLLGQLTVRRLRLLASAHSLRAGFRPVALGMVALTMPVEKKTAGLVKLIW